MILEYSYDKAVKVLEHFKNGDIAYLSIKPQGSIHSLQIILSQNRILLE